MRPKNILAGFLLSALYSVNCLAAGEHDYFDRLCARPDAYLCEGFRDPSHFARKLSPTQTGMVTTAYAPSISYSPQTDTYFQKQDAAKVVGKAFPLANEGGTHYTLSAPMGLDDKTIQLTAGNYGQLATGVGLKADKEIMVCDNPCRVPGTNTFNVLRGTYGTPKEAHPSGTSLALSYNKFGTQFGIPMRMTDEDATYLLTWDVYYTDTMTKLMTRSTSGWGVHNDPRTGLWGTQLTHFKSFRFVPGTRESGGGIEFNLSPVGGYDHGAKVTPRCCDSPELNLDTDVGTAGYDRWDTMVIGRAPEIRFVWGPTPMNIFPPFKPGKWIRYWVFIEQFKDEKHLTELLTQLDEAINPSQTTLRLQAPLDAFPTETGDGDRFTSGSSELYKGRLVKIDDEILAISDCAMTGITRLCTAQRGYGGTAAAAHQAGNSVFTSYDRITAYIADEDREPVKTFDRLPFVFPTYNNDPASRNRFGYLKFLWDVSNDRIVEIRAQRGFEDMIMYYRDFVMLKNPSEISSLLARPVPGAVPKPPAPSAPQVMSQPANRAVKVGQTATFSLTATGSSPINYQWQMRATSAGTFTDIPGAKSAVYTTPATVLTDSGRQYRCVLTNSLGTKESNPATLTVTVTAPPPDSDPDPGSDAPTLSLPQYLPINSVISAQHSGPVDQYEWSFERIEGVGVSAYRHADTPTRAASSAPSAVSRTSAPQLNLSSLPLSLGRYRITVVAYSGVNPSAPASADVTLVSADLAAVRVYPNPWRSDRHAVRSITFDQLTVNTRIKIFTISGHFVKALPPSSTSAVWDLSNDKGDRVASGTYLYLMTTDSGGKKTGKVVVIK